MRYEVGIAIRTGWIVWINGPYPPGDWPDVRIARDKLIYCLRRGEKVIADSGYGGYWFITPSGNNTIQDYRQSVVRARHETINHIFKTYNILHRTFRHAKTLHARVFTAVANLVQLHLEYEEDGCWGVQYFNDGAI